MSNLQNVKGTESSPIRIFLAIGTVHVELMRLKLGDDLFWAGRPYTDREWCKFNLVVCADGRVLGSAPANFIAAGGWGRMSKNSITAERQFQVKLQITQEFLAKVSAFSNVALRTEEREVAKANVLEALGKGFKCVDDVETDTTVAALCDVPLEMLRLAQSTNFGIVLDVDAYFDEKRYVNRNFMELTDGQWTQESDVLAISAGLSTLQVALAKKFNKRLSRTLKKAA